MWRLLSILGVVGVAGGALLIGRRANASSSTSGSTSGSSDGATPDVADIDLPPLPTAADVPYEALEMINLEKNWGDTPPDLRPLFALMEATSMIVGSARVFAVIAYRESRFVTSAHNGNAANEQDERDDSKRAWDNNKDRNPPLRFGAEAAAFGSGGLFGALAPYFLWTGVPERGKKAPLLNAPPELVFQPRAAAFGAVVYMQRLLAHYRVDDIADIKAGWANPGLLGKNRGSKTYNEVRTRFLADAKALGIDLFDPTIPAKLSAASWPGVPVAFEKLVGALPAEFT